MTKPVKSTEHQSYLTASIGRVFSQILEIHPKDSAGYNSCRLERIEQFVDSVKILGFDDKLLANYRDLSVELYNLNGHLVEMYSFIREAQHKEQAILKAEKLIEALNHTGVLKSVETIKTNLQSASQRFFEVSADIIKEITKTEQLQVVQSSSTASAGLINELIRSLTDEPIVVKSKEDALEEFGEQLGNPEAQRMSVMQACRATIEAFQKKAKRIVREHESLLRRALPDNPQIIDIISAIVSIQKIKDRKRYVAKSFRQNTFVLLLFLMLAVGFALTSYYSLGMHIPVVHMIVGMSFTGVSLLGLISVWFYQHTHAAEYVHDAKMDAATYSTDLLAEVALGVGTPDILQMTTFDFEGPAT